MCNLFLWLSHFWSMKHKCEYFLILIWRLFWAFSCCEGKVQLNVRRRHQQQIKLQDELKEQKREVAENQTSCWQHGELRQLSTFTKTGRRWWMDQSVRPLRGNIFLTWPDRFCFVFFRGERFYQTVSSIRAGGAQCHKHNQDSALNSIENLVLFLFIISFHKYFHSDVFNL